MIVGWHARIQMPICEDKCNEMTDEKRGSRGEGGSMIPRTYTHRSWLGLPGSQVVN